MSLKLNSAGGGSVTLAEPNTASTLTLTLPAVTDTLVSLTDTQTLTNKTLTSPTITGALVSSMASSVLTRGTVVPTTSGTSHDITGIPSWAKRITVMFSGVGTNSTTDMLIQIGSGSIQNTGYVSACSSGGTGAAATNGFIVTDVVTAATTQSGVATIVNFDGDTWISTSILGFSNASTSNVGGGNVTLSGALDRLRLTTVGGNTFDSGSINIMYE